MTLCLSFSDFPQGLVQSDRGLEGTPIFGSLNTPFENIIGSYLCHRSDPSLGFPGPFLPGYCFRFGTDETSGVSFRDQTRTKDHTLGKNGTTRLSFPLLPTKRSQDLWGVHPHGGGSCRPVVEEEGEDSRGLDSTIFGVPCPGPVYTDLHSFVVCQTLHSSGPLPVSPGPW